MVSLDSGFGRIRRSLLGTRGRAGAGAAVLAFAVAAGLTLPGVGWGARIGVTTTADELTGEECCRHLQVAN
jgi:hypothetical protein